MVRFSIAPVLFACVLSACVTTGRTEVLHPNNTEAREPVVSVPPRQIEDAPEVESATPAEPAQQAQPAPAAGTQEVPLSIIDPAIPVEASSTAEFAAASPPNTPENNPYELELTIWNHEDFRRRFTQSYIAETEIEPPVTEKERETLGQFSDLMSELKTDKAIQLIEKSIGPDSSAVFEFTLANLYFEQEEFERAIPLYEAAVEKYPKFRRAWGNLSLLRFHRGEYPQAAQAITRVIEGGGGNGSQYGMLGYCYGQADQQVAAESAYRMATLLDPYNPDWKVGLAVSFLKQERFANAAALFGDMLAEQPESGRLWLMQANAFLGLEKPMRAAENFELVDQLGHSTAESLNTLGDIYVNDGLYDLGADAYLRAMQLDPEAGAARAIQNARILADRRATPEARRLVAAVESFEGAELDEEGRKELLRLQARVAMAEGAGAEEARILQEIVALDPLDGEAMIHLGRYYVGREEVERGLTFFERAAAIGEEFEAEAKKQHGQVLVKQRRYAEAVPFLKRAQDLDPSETLRTYLEQVEQLAQAR